MSPEESRPIVTRGLIAAAFKFLRKKYYHKTVALFKEVALSEQFRADILCLSYDDEVVIFEVKSCRADFMTDHKWKNYLDYCNYFYFVTVPDAILPSDIPENIGLIYFDETKYGENNYNIIRECKRLKGIRLTNSWFKKTYKKLAFRIGSEY